MDSPGRHVLHLARKIGVREAGTEGEAAAASYIRRTMTESGAVVDEEVFSCWRSDVFGLVWSCILSVAAFLLFRVSYLACLLVGACAFLFFQMETYSWAVLSRIAPGSTAKNVVGRMQPSGDRENLVLLVANYDTSRSSPLSRPFLARFYRLFYLLVFVSVLLVTVLGFIGFFGALADLHPHTLFIVWLCFSPFAALPALFAGVLLCGELFGGRSPGANDNASGVGVMLSTIDAVAREPLECTEVWGIATARGFAGGRGMVAVLHRHHAQLKSAYILNIDHPGIGPPVFMRREGAVLGFAPDRRLKQLVVLAAGKTPGVNIKKGRCRVKKSDALAARARWRRAITISSATGPSYPGWRRTDDVYDSIDPDALDRTERLVLAVLAEIDKG